MSSSFEAPECDLSKAAELLAESNQLFTFADVEAWDRVATIEIRRLRFFVEELDHRQRELASVEAQALSAHAAKSFLKRLFSRPKQVRQIVKWRDRASALRYRIEAAVDSLEDTVDRTPNSLEEQRLLLKELKLRKKELNQHKREIGLAMRQIRDNARRQNAEVGTGLGLVFSNPTSRRFERMSIRLEKEGALKSQENARDALERQITAIDRAMLWAERIK
jgi:hypothetical protein